MLAVLRWRAGLIASDPHPTSDGGAAVRLQVGDAKAHVGDVTPIFWPKSKHSSRGEFNLRRVVATSNIYKAALFCPQKGVPRDEESPI